MKSLSILVLITFICFAQSVLSKTNDDNAIQEIMGIVEDFRLSIINKDEQKFINLFYDKSIPWLGVESDRRKGKLPSQNGVRQGNYLAFIANIVRNKKKTEEKLWDIKVITDGEVGSVHFKYSFHKDEYKSNWGDEYWQLIRTPEGWKINSVIYSITRNPLPRDASN